MDKLTSILAVIDPADESRHVVAKAMVLARHFRARVELFLCDSERAYTLRHTYDPAGLRAANRECLAGGLQYLESIRRSIAEDVEVTTHVASSSPLYEAIVQRVLETRPDLVIKSAAGHHPLQRFTLDANDWQLARTCPVPLMLTRGRPWSAAGRFAAAVDVSDAGNGSLARSILQTAGFLTLGCGGQLDVVYSESNASDREGAANRRDSLERLVNEFRVGRESQHVLQGSAEDTLPEFAGERGYDLVILGALTRRRGLSALVGTLTSKLVDALDCDFVLVKPESFVAPAVERNLPIPGTPVFGGEEAQRGYALNRMCYSFNSAANREAFRDDEEGYCTRFGLDEQQKDAVRRRDVLAMIEAGGNIYYLSKLAGIFGLNVQDIGAQQTGVSVEAFRARLMEAAK